LEATVKPGRGWPIVATGGRDRPTMLPGMLNRTCEKDYVGPDTVIPVIRGLR